MDIEVKQTQTHTHNDTNNNCELEDISSNEELFEEFQKIIKSKKPQEYKINNKNKEKPINKEKNEFYIHTKVKQNKVQPLNIEKQVKSNEYTSSSGLGEDNNNFKNMYMNNIQKSQNVQKNLNDLLDKNILKQLESDDDSDKLLEKNANTNIKILKNSDSNPSTDKELSKKKSKYDNVIDSNSDSNIDSKENIIYEKNKDDNSIDNEFKQFFSKDRKKKLDTGSKNKPKDEQLKKLEKYYDKAINKQKEQKDKVKNGSEVLDENKHKKRDLVKILLDSIERKIFLESTRGFNLDENIYKINMSKFKTNLLNFKLPLDSPKYTIGYLYRDYTNPKVYSLINETNFWLDTYKNSNSPSIIEKELDSKDKFLLSCLKNFKQTRKFKKQIGSTLVRAQIKTVEVLNTKNLIIDVIIYVKYKQ